MQALNNVSKRISACSRSPVAAPRPVTRYIRRCRCCMPSDGLTTIIHGACRSVAPSRAASLCVRAGEHLYPLPSSDKVTGLTITYRIYCVRAATFAPPSVSTTKANFLQNYKKPIAAIYNVVIQELIVQQHFARYSINYEYNEVRQLASSSSSLTDIFPCCVAVILAAYQ